MLEPGCYIDSHWGHYQTPRVIQLALELGWEPGDRHEVERMVELYDDQEWDQIDTDILYEVQDEAENYINDFHVPEGFWFGHHPDHGDFGVWELDDDD